MKNTAQEKREWTYKFHTYTLADTGDYDSYVQFTNGKDICQSCGDEMDESDAQRFCDLLNKMPDFWSHSQDGLEFENSQLKRQIDETRIERTQKEVQSTTVHSGLFDLNEKEIRCGDTIEVCVFMVSPQNPDDDHHFRGEVFFDYGSFQIKIREMMSAHTDGKWLPLDWRCGLDRDMILDDGTIIMQLFDLCSMSGNLGEYNPENVEIVERTQPQAGELDLIFDSLCELFRTLKRVSNKNPHIFNNGDYARMKRAAEIMRQNASSDNIKIVKSSPTPPQVKNDLGIFSIREFEVSPKTDVDCAVYQIALDLNGTAILFSDEYSDHKSTWFKIKKEQLDKIISLLNNPPQVTEDVRADALERLKECQIYYEGLNVTESILADFAQSQQQAPDPDSIQEDYALMQRDFKSPDEPYI